MQILLASASPRRCKILRQLGLSFQTVPPGVEEVLYADSPERTVKENALRKWKWCAIRHPGAAIIAADTMVELEGKVLGKPKSGADALAMLKAASGRMQTVYTGYVLSKPGETSPTPALETSKIYFHSLSDERIQQYLDTVNPMDRAGAYDIDCHGDWIIQRCEGSFTNVMGLPVERIKEWLLCKSKN